MKLHQIQISVASSLRRIMQHPFIRKANSHSLTREQTYTWIMCAGRESRVFPTILEKMTEACSGISIRTILTRNLEDEMGNGNPEEAHYNHYLTLLDTLGISRSKFSAYEERSGIGFALSLAYSISRENNEARALGYLLVNEAMTPSIYRAVQKSLRIYHPKLNTDFFRLHITSDQKHVRALYEGIRDLRPAMAKDIVFGIQIGERGMACLLDEAYGVFDKNSSSKINRVRG